MPPAYPYRELRGENWIHFLTILPKQKYQDDKIEISLSDHHLSSNQPYETLSHMCEDLSSLWTIYCDGAILEISYDLYLCLLGLRKEGLHHFLWVDAICIDQRNLREKSRTLPLIPLIYKNAAYTICWIPTPLLPSVSRLVDHLQSRWAQLPQQGSIITDPDPYHTDIKITAADLDSFQADPLLQGQQAWEDLENFVNLQYFQEIWISLDWVTSHNLTLRYGSDSLSWEKFCSALESSQDIYDGVFTSHPVTNNLPETQLWHDRIAALLPLIIPGIPMNDNRDKTSDFHRMVSVCRGSEKRARRTEDLNAQTLLEFANTIQTRGCNSIWEQGTPPDPKDLVKQVMKFLTFLEEEGMEAAVDVQLFYAACLPSHGRRFGVTGRGNFCLVPKDAKRDDLICVPHGNRVPLVFRKMKEHYVNLGECYVDGCMQSGVRKVFNSRKYEVFNIDR